MYKVLGKKGNADISAVGGKREKESDWPRRIGAEENTSRECFDLEMNAQSKDCILVQQEFEVQSGHFEKSQFRDLKRVFR